MQFPVEGNGIFALDRHNVHGKEFYLLCFQFSCNGDFILLFGFGKTHVPGFGRGSTLDFYRFEPCPLEVHNLNLSGSIQHCLDVKKLVGTVQTACRCSV